MKNAKAITLIIAAAILVALAVFAAMRYRGRSTNPSPARRAGAFTSASVGLPAAVTAKNQTGQVKFSTSPYAQFAYLISGNTISPDAQRALTGYELVRTKLPNGNLEITLRPTSAPAPDQLYTLTPGESLYFVDYVLGDDTQPKDYSPNDDKAVVVDQNGYIAAQ